MAKKKEWWQTHFDTQYLKTYIDIANPAKTRQQVEFVIRKLKLNKKTKILDLPCGYGRHSIPLAKRGYNVTGLDYSKKFIAKAKRKQKELELKNVTFVQGDMRNLRYKNKFDVIINMFTSFGYFDDEKDNLKVLKNMHKALKPKGKLLMDLFNESNGISKMIQDGKFDKKKNIWVQSRKVKQSNGLTVTTIYYVDLINMRWNMARSWKEKGKTKGYKTSMRIYPLPEISYLLEEAGFKVQKVWGDFNGEPLSVKSRRMIILAEK